MTSTSAAFRALMAGPPFVVADCYSALTARIVEHVGFPAGYLGGHATGMMHYAIPDVGVLTPTEMVEQAGRVAEAVAIPVIADADQAGESVADVHRTIRRFEHAGVAGVHIEDEQTPKHSAFDGPLLPIAEMPGPHRGRGGGTARPRLRRHRPLRRAVRREGGGGTGSLEEAIRRGVAYAEAGADVYLPTMATPEQVRGHRRRGAHPDRRLREAGRGPGLQPVHRLGHGIGGPRPPASGPRHLLEHGDLPPEAYAFAEKDALIGEGAYDEVVRAWATRTGRPLRP